MKTPSPTLRLERLEDRTVPTLFGVPWADPNRITLSFAPDGTTLPGGGASSLFQTMDAAAPRAVWQGEILRAFQDWAATGNLNVALVSDNGDPLGVNGAVQGDPRFGDIRIAAAPMANTAVGSGAPFSWTGTTFSGDVYFNSRLGFGVSGAAGKYDIYSVAVHEAGHVFGLGHTDDPGGCGCASCAAASGQSNSNSAMASGYRTYTGLSAEDVTNLRALYGPRTADAYDAASNNSFATADKLPGSLVQQSLRADLTTASDVDYYKISAPLLSAVTGLSFRVIADGVSMLTPKVTVYNGSKVQLKTASTTNPQNNDVSVTIGSFPLATYYVKVEGAREDSFGVGGYRLIVDSLMSDSSLLTAPILSYIPIVDSLTNDVLSLATNLLTTSDTVDARFDATYQAQVSSSNDVDSYRVQVPQGQAGADVNLVVMTWALEPNGLNPRIRVFNEDRQPVAFQVLSNDAGIVSVQVPAVQGNSYMYFQVSARDTADSAHNRGAYFLAVDFGYKPLVAFDALAAAALSQSSPTDTASLTMGSGAVMEFALTAQSTAAASVTMTIVDADGNVVMVMTAKAGQPTVTRTLYLGAGTYSVRYAASGLTGSQTATYSLHAYQVNEGVGTYATTTNSGGSSSGNTGSGGYTYNGSSQQPSSGQSYWF